MILTENWGIDFNSIGLYLLPCPPEGTQKGIHKPSGYSYKVRSPQGASRKRTHLRGVVFFNIWCYSPSMFTLLLRKISIFLSRQTRQAVKEQNRRTQAEELSSIRQRRFITPKNSSSSLELLREGRNR